ncbi:MAG: response regulator receiver protein [Aureispira sp.]|nr:response regulator receiver protein [Aureispira sp.]
MIDDDIDLASSLRNRARRYQVLITYKTNFKEGFEELMATQKYQAVILDGKAPMTPDQPKGTEAENFVHEAMTKLRELELTHQRTIPFCVHTAWYAQLEPGLRNRAKLFDKKKTAVDDNKMEEMFEYLHLSIADLEETKVKQQHVEVFEFAEQYLDEEDNGLLLSILAAKVTAKREVLLERLAFIRRIEESLLNVFCKECLGTDPMLFGLSGQSRGKDLIELIKKRKLAPLHVSFMMYVIYTTQSLAVQHKAPESSEFYNYPITPYTVHTFVNALLDMIVWVKYTIENGLKESGTGDYGDVTSTT